MALRSFSENIKYLSVALWDLWCARAARVSVVCIGIRSVIISKASFIYSGIAFRFQLSPLTTGPTMSNVSIPR